MGQSIPSLGGSERLPANEREGRETSLQPLNHAASGSENGWPVADTNSEVALRGLGVALWLLRITPKNGGLELNGARSNPRAGVELSRVGALHDELLRRALANPRKPRPVPTKVSPVLETITLVLERAEKPMRAREIHAVASELAGKPLLRTSVKAALAAGMAGKSPRFRRVRNGVYQTAKSDNARQTPLLKS